MTSKNSHRTAISRNKPSAPMTKLNERSSLYGRMLDYGCGRGRDAETFGMDKYDPHYAPDKPSGVYDVITCNFVLNVIEDEAERVGVLHDIQNRMHGDSIAYITVRADKNKLNGCTSIGTWQGFICLDLPIYQKGKGYITYRMTRDDYVTTAPVLMEEEIAC